MAYHDPEVSGREHECLSAYPRIVPLGAGGSFFLLQLVKWRLLVPIQFRE